jgi:hypothetical protein
MENSFELEGDEEGGKVESQESGKWSDFDFHTFVADCYDVKV